MTLHHLHGRVVKLEDEQEAADHTAPQVVIHFSDDDTPLPPGTRVLHIEFNGPAWWEVIGAEEDA